MSPFPKSRILAVLMAAAVLLAAAPAGADTLVDTFGVGDTYHASSGHGVGCIPFFGSCLARLDRAMKFTVTAVGTDYYLDTIAVPVINTRPAFVGDVEVAIAEDNAGLPGAVLDTQIITADSTAQILTATFSGAVILTSTTTYWVQLSWINPDALVSWRKTNTAVTQTYATSSNAGASWYTDTDVVAAYRVTGTAVTPPGKAMVDFATGDADSVLFGAAAGDELSRDRSVAVGDLNGDGVKDLIVGARLANGPADYTRVAGGEVYVYYGKAALASTLDAAGVAGTAPDVTIYGATAGDELSSGGALAVGDVTGDGIDDLVIGARFADGPLDGRGDAGEAYLIAGSGSLPYSIDLASAEADVVIYGITAGDALTREGALLVGDVTGDGIADIILGAPDADGPLDGRGGCGEVYIVAGSGSLPYTLDLAAFAYDVIVYGADAGDALSEDGALILGDFTADGILDLVAGTSLGDGLGNGAADAGEAYIIAGSGSLPYTYDLSLGDEDSVIYGGVAGDGLTTGKALAVGDFNGDGADDLLLGAPYADGNGASAGEAYVVYGSTTLAASIDIGSSQEDVTIDGVEAGDELGAAVAAGDLNGDGLDEILLGAPKADGPANGRAGAGEAYIFYGNAALAASLDLSVGDEDVIIYGATAGDDLTGGGGILPGDYNGDGLLDLLLAAPQADGPGDGRNAAGEGYLIYGSAGLAASLDIFNGDQDVILFGATNSDSLGYTGTLAAGDLNDDGVDDAILGAYLADGPSGGRASAGEAYLVFGTPPPTTATVIQTDHAGDAVAKNYGTARVEIDFDSGDAASSTTAILTRNDLGTNWNRFETADVRWRITTDRTNFSATLVFHYLDNEAAAQDEEDLVVYAASNLLGTWTELATTVDTEKNTATVTGVTSFSYFMLRDDPLQYMCFIGAARDHGRGKR
ncbi:MAG: choice-of-anchor R domain-containing protein [Pseudomonadota bacterium]